VSGRPSSPWRWGSAAPTQQGGGGGGGVAEGRRAAGTPPPFDYPGYRSTALRAPGRPLLRLPFGPTELSGPPVEALTAGRTIASLTDLTRQHAGEPLGERIVVGGHVLGSDGRPLPRTPVEGGQGDPGRARGPPPGPPPAPP